METMEFDNSIKPFYKNDIPEDWEKLTIGDLISFSGGSQPPQKTFLYEETEGYIRLIQTRDYRTDQFKTFVLKDLIRKTCNKDDIMIGRYGPPVFQIFRGLEGAYNVALIKATPIEKVDKDYCFYFLSRPELRFYIESLSQRSGGQTGVDIDKLNEYPFPLPPIFEQLAIKKLLLKWDETIKKTQSLIVQKELHKIWLMQNLLTGKKRLKGFEGEWKKLGAGEVFKSISIKGFENEELLSATQDKGIIPRTQLEGRVTMPDGTTSGYKLVEPGDFIISLRSFQGGLEYSYYRGIVSPAYTVLKPRKKINDEFYKQYYKSNEFIDRLAIAVIGIRDGKQISYDDFCTIKIPYPYYEEQTAIAQVLQAADKEIQLLKAKVEKLKEQKKGLMQVLLTGKKRLKID